MFDYITLHWAELLQIIGAVIGAAALIAALTPTPVDDGVVKFLRKIIDLVGANWGNAKNEKK